MKWKIDLGFDGGEGPWLSWHPQASRNGTRSPNTWTLRSADGEVATTEAPTRGFILDLEMIRTGWESASGRSGVAPERRWNATADRYEPQPGPDWKRSFSLPVAFTKEQRATWEQASLAARIALDDLCKALAADPVDHGEQVPFVRQTGTKEIRTPGGATVAPVLTLIRWVDRPAILDRSVNPDEELLPNAPSREFVPDLEPDDAGDWAAEPPEPSKPAEPRPHSERFRAALNRIQPQAEPLNSPAAPRGRPPRKRATAAPAQPPDGDAELNDVIPF